MITDHDLQEAIAECEGQRNPTANTCLKLAAYYTIRDKMFPQSSPQHTEPVPEPVFYSRAAAPMQEGEVGYMSDTEFGRVVHGLDFELVIPLIDELMSTLEVVCPRIYKGVLRKLAEL